MLASALLTLALAVGAGSSPTQHPGSAQLMGLAWSAAGAPAGSALARRLVFSTAPDSSAGAAERYQVLAAYLSRAIGRDIVYEPAGSWPAYQRGLRTGAYDLVVNNSPIVSWLIATQGHEPLVRVSARDRFVVITGHQQPIRDIGELAGRRICAPALPALGTLSLYARFDNPARRPLLVPRDTAADIYETLSAGDCEAAVLPADVYPTLPSTGRSDRTLLTTPAMPGATLTAGRRLLPREKAAITQALLAPPHEERAAGLREFVPANPAEYEGLAALLHPLWGFDS